MERRAGRRGALPGALPGVLLGRRRHAARGARGRAARADGAGVGDGGDARHGPAELPQVDAEALERGRPQGPLAIRARLRGPRGLAQLLVRRAQPAALLVPGAGLLLAEPRVAPLRALGLGPRGLVPALELLREPPLRGAHGGAQPRDLRVVGGLGRFEGRGARLRGGRAPLAVGERARVARAIREPRGDVRHGPGAGGLGAGDARPPRGPRGEGRRARAVQGARQRRPLRVERIEVGLRAALALGGHVDGAHAHGATARARARRRLARDAPALYQMHRLLRGADGVLERREAQLEAVALALGVAPRFLRRGELAPRLAELELEELARVRGVLARLRGRLAGRDGERRGGLGLAPPHLGQRLTEPLALLPRRVRRRDRTRRLVLAPLAQDAGHVAVAGRLAGRRVAVVAEEREAAALVALEVRELRLEQRLGRRGAVVQLLQEGSHRAANGERSAFEFRTAGERERELMRRACARSI